MDELRFDGRVALVTGGGRGMGREHCLLFAERGAAVVVNDLGGSLDGQGSDEGPATQVAEEIIGRGGRAIPNVDSVAAPGGAERIIENAVEAFGRVDIVVTNAGIHTESPFAALDADALRPMLDVHAWGTWRMLRAAWPHFMAQRYGRAVCINSAAGLYGMAGLSTYSAAKATILGIVRTLALEGREHGIQVNALAPGGRSRMSATTDPAWVAFADKHMHASLVSPAVALLAHESCDASGRLFSCIGHRLSEVVLSETRGFSLDAEEWTVESIREGWDQVVDREGAYEPRSAADAMRFALDCMGLQHPSGTIGGEELASSRAASR